MILVKKFLFAALAIHIALLSISTVTGEDNAVIAVDEPKDNEIVLNQIDGDFKFEIDENTDEFVATNEWQPIKPGQSIPKGLHVRMNIVTGEREAKLLDDDSRQQQQKQSKLTSNDEAETDEMRKKRLISEKVKDSIKKLEMPDSTGEGEEELKSMLKSFKKSGQDLDSTLRSFDQLKKELNDIDLSLSTDAEILKSMVTTLNSSSTNKEQKLKILAEFENYVHQYDNGLLLCDLGGFNIIVSLINSTTTTNADDEFELKSESLLVLGSAMQSNPKVQMHAMKADLLKILLKSLIKSYDEPKVKFNEYQSRLLFALSTLLRHFPLAQAEFVQYGGIDVLNRLMESARLKSKIKILTLTSDLIDEKKQSALSNQTDQYKDINLSEKLVENNWCNHYVQMLELDSLDHDSVEKLVDSMSSLVDDCLLANKELNMLEKALNAYVNKYTQLIADSNQSGEEDNYFAGLQDKLKLIYNKISSTRRTDL